MTGPRTPRDRYRMSFSEVAVMMRQPSNRRPVPPPPSLHQMARARLDEHQDDDATKYDGGIRLTHEHGARGFARRRL